MRCSISSSVLDAIVALAAEAPASEVCGLLFGAAGVIDAFRPAANVAADPARSFEIDPATLFAALRAERAGGPRIAGCYHSHPGGDAAPSVTDAAMSARDGWLWLIVAGAEVRLWHAVPGGRVHGAFDPVAIVSPVAAG